VNVNVGYDPGSRGGRRAAVRIASQIDGKIWPAFQGLLGRTPPADDGQSCFHGPDGKLDVYLTTARRFGDLSLPRRTVALSHPFSSEPCAPLEPDFLVARPGAPRWVIAHKLFHAFQSAYRRAQACIHYHEWEEATATWAGDFVYPGDDIEHNHPGAIERPEINLDFWGYGTWVFPYYLTKKYGNPVIRRIEEAGETYPADEHVNKAIPGGFRERFPEFALYAWNQAPLPRTDKIKRSFRLWDGIRDVPHPGKKPVKERKLRLRGARSRTEPWPARLRALGRDYRHYSVVDKKIRHIRLENLSPNPALGVTAFVRIARKGWQVRTWTGRSEVGFCRDDPDEDVRELVIALSNTRYPDAISVKPKLKLERACSLYLGEVNGSVSFDQTPCPGANHGRLTYNAKLQKTTQVGGRPQPFPIAGGTSPGLGLAAWGYAESGNGNWTEDACPDDDYPGCSTTMQPAPGGGMHGHVIFSVEGETVKATARAFSWKRNSDSCGPIDVSLPVFGVGRFPLDKVGAETITVPLAIHERSDDDGFVNETTGSGTLTLHRVKR
jgi:hypothetical protein